MNGVPNARRPERATFTGELAEALHQVVQCSPSPCAVTHGPLHKLVYYNLPFQHLLTPPAPGKTIPVTEVLPALAVPRGQAMLDRAWTLGKAVDEQVSFSPRLDESWSCSISPLCDSRGATSALLIQLRPLAPTSTSMLQREITEQLVLSTLQAVDATEQAETSLAQSEFLAKAGLLLGMSLSSSVTRVAVAGMSLPIPGTWCIVDLIEADGTMSRLPILHPDAAKREALQELSMKWMPLPGDPFGAPAIQDELQPVVITQDVDAAIVAAAHSDENLRLLRSLGMGTLLTVPLVLDWNLLGAVTFVSSTPAYSFTVEEIRLAQTLAARNAEALENARVYTEALRLREQADLATRNKLRFLANISHELRSPLGAMLGYVELMSEGIHGPLTAAQRTDLDRIRATQRHLTKLVDDLLTYVQKGAPRVNEIVRLRAHDLLVAAVSMIENTMSRKSIQYHSHPSDDDVVCLGDRDRVSQILVNLLANAVKFTPRGGEIATSCEATDDQVHISVTDSGIGIDASKFEQIFEPFVQVHDIDPAEGGFGLGLAISRDLARAMHGELTVASERGAGSRFTLTLPRATA